jgi:hypothetical protein
MNSEFTYIIRSNNKDSTTDYTSNCFIRLTGLPSNFQEYECEVVGFYISTALQTFASSIIELRAEGLSFLNGGDTSNIKNTVAFNVVNATQPIGRHVFKVHNFNNQRINFKLYNEYNEILETIYNGGNIDSFNTPWILVLKMKGITKTSDVLKALN